MATTAAAPPSTAIAGGDPRGRLRRTIVLLALAALSWALAAGLFAVDVTEYGVVNLKGKSMRERALGIIDLAHPKFRDELLGAAKDLGLV